MMDGDPILKDPPYGWHELTVNTLTTSAIVATPHQFNTLVSTRFDLSRVEGLKRVWAQAYSVTPGRRGFAVEFTHHVRERDTGRETELVMMREFIVSHYGQDAMSVGRFLLDSLEFFARHEVREAIRLDDRRPFDPHVHPFDPFDRFNGGR